MTELWQTPVAPETVHTIMRKAAQLMSTRSEAQQTETLNTYPYQKIVSRGANFLQTVGFFATNKQLQTDNVRRLQPKGYVPKSFWNFDFTTDGPISITHLCYRGLDQNGNLLKAARLLVHDDPSDQYAITHTITEANMGRAYGQDEMVPLDANQLDGETMQHIFYRLEVNQLQQIGMFTTAARLEKDDASHRATASEPAVVNPPQLYLVD